MDRFMTKLITDECGQDLIEYSLLPGLISLACVTMVLNLGSGVEGVYDNLETQAAALSN